ncbi:bacillithiol system redox-active protein YtxJ [Paenibacillus beijingensis]|uniref:General stress protein n=1 Tax=Paenibacillus beijingensis TaxID=1126833 RepID=A0A0D5NMN4_9BACL|nr:bacillithiol system redox-active protein YtxJ [Paenibacillus beijingensis]AJY76425.1 general stress protein [Paenibacillus beijingensis]
MSLYRSLMTVEDWKEVYEASKTKPLLVFKHSTRCSVSAEAHEAWSKWLNDSQELPVENVLVRVVEERPVSNAIEESTGVKHASPQAILIADGEVKWHTSHWNITYASLEEHLREHCTK